MSQILQIICFNVDFNIKYLCNLKCVDKQSLIIANESIELKRLQSLKNEKIGKEHLMIKIPQNLCNICKKRKIQHIYPFCNEPICFDCKQKNQCCEKEVRKKYNLAGDDLKSIDFYYKNGKKYFSLLQIQEKTILKNGKMHNNMGASYAKFARIKKVEVIESMYKLIPYVISKKLSESYIRNGSKGIKYLYYKHEKCYDLIKQLDENNICIDHLDLNKFIDLNETFDVFKIKKRILECNAMLKDEEKRKYVTYLDSTIDRKNNLLNILEKEGFDNILDIIESNICKSYILGYIKPIEREKEMKILLENIKYQNIVMKDRKSLNNP